MAYAVLPLSSALGAEVVRGIDLRERLDSATMQAITHAFIVPPMPPIRFQMFQIVTFRLNTGTHSWMGGSNVVWDAGSAAQPACSLRVPQQNASVHANPWSSGECRSRRKTCPSQEIFSWLQLWLS